MAANLELPITDYQQIEALYADRAGEIPVLDEAAVIAVSGFLKAHNYKMLGGCLGQPSDDATIGSVLGLGRKSLGEWRDDAFVGPHIMGDGQYRSNGVGIWIADRYE